MEQKIEFICEWRTGKYSISELCKRFVISRPTAYKNISRFEEDGYEGLRELSRKPRGIHPNATNEKVVNRILKLKENHKLWGAKKIWKLLYSDFPGDAMLTVLIVHNILKKHGLVKPQKRLRRVKPITTGLSVCCNGIVNSKRAHKIKTELKLCAKMFRILNSLIQTFNLLHIPLY
ncbi:helix-turn-helix domain containing protein [Carboxylicivirga linearis]|uniref:Helix-turn-helix domain containing protein n=2 Tax=Carboxylicivirga linearis TaxID=1628157 RepID=A0ABS5K234_9BACT|nr:helix-turn-helix domain containing protein [Carboxylicivirga linearis]